MSNNIVKYFISQENQKYESKSKKKYPQLNKKTAKRLRELYRNLSADEKIKKKKKYVSIRNKKMSNTDRERKKEYLKNYSYEII